MKKTWFSPLFDLPPGEWPEINHDGRIVNDRSVWTGGWFPTRELATEVGIEYANENDLIFVGVA